MTAYRLVDSRLRSAITVFNWLIIIALNQEKMVVRLCVEAIKQEALSKNLMH